MTLEEIEQWEYLRNKMEHEGFHYCFESYSSWKEIEDETFHKLRLNYLETAKSLNDYVEKKIEEIDE